MRVICFILLFSPLFLSALGNDSSFCKLKEMYELQNNNKRTFTYRPDGKLSDFMAIDSPGIITADVHLKYNANGQLVEINGIDNASFEYNSSGNILRVISYDTNSVRLSVANFFYNEKGQVIKRDFISFNPKNPSKYRVFTYDERGNVKTMLLYSLDGKLRNSFEYEYDTKPGIYRALSTTAFLQDDWVRWGPNNVVKEYVQQPHKTAVLYSTFYKYNSSGYPVEKTTTYFGKTIKHFSYKYDCK